MLLPLSLISKHINGFDRSTRPQTGDRLLRVCRLLRSCKLSPFPNSSVCLLQQNEQGRRLVSRKEREKNMHVPSFVNTPVMRPHTRYLPRTQALRTDTRRPATASLAHPTAPVEVTSSEIVISTTDGADITAYLTTPVASVTPSPGVLMLSDIHGHDNADTRRVADFLASRSFPTIIPDLFRGNPWPNIRPDDSYEAWRMTHPMERVHSDISTTAAEMQARGFANPLGLLGFCFGGGRAMHELSLAEAGTNPAAVVAFYPTRFDPVAAGERGVCPLMFISGDEDALVPNDVIESLRLALETKNSTMADCEMVIVEGAGHAFAHRPKSDDDIADSEYLLQKTVEWFRTHLK